MANITPNTKFYVTVGGAVTLLVAIISAVHLTTTILNSIDQRLAAVSAVAKDAYPMAAASEQALRMAIENPGIKVPDPRNPRDIIEVRRAH